MSGGTVYGQHFSVRIPDTEAARFDAMARAAGLRRSELLRLVILRSLTDEPVAFSGAELQRARTIGGPT